MTGFQVHAHALDARGEPSKGKSVRFTSDVDYINLLDEFLSLDIAHSMDTSNTIAIDNYQHISGT